MTSWEDIKKLSADLHRVQLGEAAKKLSERNCIEIVHDLIEKRLIDVVFSIDGKEYITRDYLRTQILNETYANGGRLSLVSLQQLLNIHYQNIDDECKRIVGSQPDIMLCLGQLITRDYFNQIFKEIDQKLNDFGRLTLSEITVAYDLPTDLLSYEIAKELGGKIRASMDNIDGGVYYTESYIQLQKSVLSGALIAVTRPVQISKLINDLQIEPGLFFGVFDELSRSKQIRGSLSGGRVLERCVYVPDIFVESSERSFKDFFYQHGYLEFSALKRLNIQNPNAYLTKLLALNGDSLISLKTTVISREIFLQLECSMHAALKTNLWTNVSDHLQLPLSSVDFISLIDLLDKRRIIEMKRCSDCYFYVDDLVEKFIKFFQPLISEKASQESSHKPPLIDAKESQNSDKKQKSVKEAKGKKKKIHKDDDDDSLNFLPTSSAREVIFMSKDDLIDTMQREFEDETYPNDILAEIADKISNSLNAKYREQLQSVYLNQQVTSLKKNHSDFVEKFKNLYQNICVFYSSLQLFDNLVGEQLKVHLLRTLCVDLINLALGYFAHVPNFNQMSAKLRDTTIESLSNPAKSSFQQIVVSLNNKDLTEFFDAVDSLAASNVCSINVKQPDKKTKLELINRNKTELRAQLLVCNESSVVLLLSCLYLISHYWPECMIHASGKFVTHFIALLQEKIPKSLYSLLLENQKAVVQLIKSKDDVTAQNEAKQKCDELKNSVLSIPPVSQ